MPLRTMGRTALLSYASKKRMSLWRTWRRTEPPALPADAVDPADPDAPERTRIAALTGFVPGALGVYRQAFRHRSVLRGQPDGHLASNERLEFLGDAILGFVVSEHLCAQFADVDEGFLSRLRAKLVSGKALAQYAGAIGLGGYLEMSDEMRASGGEEHRTLLADGFEALIGALYLDRGIDAARDFVHRTALRERDLEKLAARTDNYKSVLLERAQSEGWPQPTYRTVLAEGAAHERVFTVEAVVNGAALGAGTARSKKAAEQLAARAALEHLDAENPDTEPAS